jgi:4-amino-4-deoxy-L-arabinose transferase-like glycosyltransferase
MDKIKLIPYLLLAIIFTLLTWINIAWSDLSILQMKSIDEYAFHNSLLTMHDGLMNFDIKKLFSFGFYSYGFDFFIINLMATFPFLSDASSNISIILPRIVTSIFAIITLVYLLKIMQLQKANILEQVLLIVLIALMPGFWTNATWMHPDYMMAAFLCASIYYLSTSISTNEKNHKFWLGIILWGLAVATKIQAVTFAPVLLGIVIWKWHNHETSLKEALRLLVISGLIILVIFIITNPYIIHPRGAVAWWNTFTANMLSNATNHGLVGAVSLSQKLSIAVGNYYLSIPLFALMMLSALWFLVKDWVNKQLTANSLIALYALPNIAYLLFAVNKDWEHYYLAPLLIGTVLIVNILKLLPKNSMICLSMVVLVVIQIYSFSNDFKERIMLRLDEKVVSADSLHRNKKIIYQESNLLALAQENTNFVKPYINEDTILAISPYTAFDYGYLGMKYDKVKIIYGPLREEYFEYSEKHKRKGTKPVNLIILRLNDTYFNEQRLSKMVDQEGYQHAKQLIDDWKKEQGEFSLLVQNARLIIFKKKIKIK